MPLSVGSSAPTVTTPVRLYAIENLMTVGNDPQVDRDTIEVDRLWGIQRLQPSVLTFP